MKVILFLIMFYFYVGICYTDNLGLVTDKDRAPYILFWPIFFVTSFYSICKKSIGVYYEI